jgi:hypothetical protein
MFYGCDEGSINLGHPILVVCLLCVGKDLVEFPSSSYSLRNVTQQTRHRLLSQQGLLSEWKSLSTPVLKKV